MASLQPLLAPYLPAHMRHRAAQHHATPQSAQVAKAKQDLVEDQRFANRMDRLKGDFYNAWLDYRGLSAILEEAVHGTGAEAGSERFRTVLAANLHTVNKYYHTSIKSLSEEADRLVQMREDGIPLEHSKADFIKEINRLVQYLSLIHI
eukprot:TRINITY_DN4680_c0_g1_i3.p2 TRINITY_DN4680_c0_g1~~TRINITY_DN4680_c0_g1_i3.p2  ORF type:complete len:149 (-),score=45.32 TRINITY_DN4680_c0_g1_i3:112-558(-)